jgi:hypothetical protein
MLSPLEHLNIALHLEPQRHEHKEEEPKIAEQKATAVPMYQEDK